MKGGGGQCKGKDMEYNIRYWKRPNAILMSMAKIPLASQPGLS